MAGRIYFNNWELLALEAGLRLLRDQVKAQLPEAPNPVPHYTSIELLLEKIGRK